MTVGLGMLGESAMAMGGGGGEDEGGEGAFFGAVLERRQAEVDDVVPPVRAGGIAQRIR